MKGQKRKDEDSILLAREKRKRTKKKKNIENQTKKGESKRVNFAVRERLNQKVSNQCSKK